MVGVRVSFDEQDTAGPGCVLGVVLGAAMWATAWILWWVFT